MTTVEGLFSSARFISYVTETELEEEEEDTTAEAYDMITEAPPGSDCSYVRACVPDLWCINQVVQASTVQHQN